MLIELAHYTVLFALTVVGLQTFLLCPTLWSSGSAIAIRLGFRGICFTTALLLFSFLVLLSGFIVHDFSLAVVFESFDSQSGSFYALQAFCSTREGFFFTFIVLLTFVFLSDFSKRELATYQERGRYLFAGGGLIFFLLILMLMTADPFIRIEEPPFEGIGFKQEWRPPYKILSTLFSFGSCALLTVSFIKMICMYSKGRQFVRPILRDNLLALILLLCAAGTELMTSFTLAGSNGTLWQWMPVNTLLLSVILLTAGQIVLLFFCNISHVFTNWIVFLSFSGAALSNASFFAEEYRLFDLSDSEVYFPNPVAALCALAGVICFLLFLCSVAVKKTFKENDFSVFSRESFIGLSVTALTAASISIGLLSLTPALFMFLPDLPLRLLPALIKTTLFRTLIPASLLFFIAFRRKSVVTGWVTTNGKTALIFCGGILTAICLCYYKVPHAKQILFHTLPAILILGSAVCSKTFKIPGSFNEAICLFRSVPAFTYGIFFIAVGFSIFSFALSYAVFNQTKTIETYKFQDLSRSDIPCAVEQLTGKAETAGARYRLLCKPPLELLNGNPNFQWPEKKLKAAFLHTTRFSTRLIQVNQNQEDTLSVRIICYPALQPAVCGIFLICSGLLFFLLSIRKESAP